MSHQGSEMKADTDKVQKALELLGEHFDTVHIFCTRHESGEMGGTINISMGTGNWFARFGHIRSWLIKEDEATRVSMRKDD